MHKDAFERLIGKNNAAILKNFEKYEGLKLKK
jgi:hypothetical protein